MLFRDVIIKRNEILRTINNKNVEIVETREVLNWNDADTISYSTVKELFNFNIYSLRQGVSSIYYIGNNPPEGFNKLKGYPAGSSWKEIRKPSCMYVKMITIDGKETNVYKKRM